MSNKTGLRANHTSNRTVTRFYSFSAGIPNIIDEKYGNDEPGSLAKMKQSASFG